MPFASWAQIGWAAALCFFLVRLCSRVSFFGNCWAIPEISHVIVAHRQWWAIWTRWSGLRTIQKSEIVWKRAKPAHGHDRRRSINCDRNMALLFWIKIRYCSPRREIRFYCICEYLMPSKISNPKGDGFTRSGKDLRNRKSRNRKMAKWK